MIIMLILHGMTLIEHAAADAIENEMETVAHSARYAKYNADQQHGIAKVRAYRMAATYADMFSVDADALRQVIAGTDQPRELAYWNRESKRKLYA